MSPDRLDGLRVELALKVARLIGSAENLATPIPRVTLHRRTAPTAPCPATYAPSVIVIAQGRKQVELGNKKLTYDSSRYLLTSVDLPTVSRVVEASEDLPCLALALKLDIAIVREFLSREEFHALDLAPESAAMSTGAVSAEFLSGCCRLLDLLANPQDIPFLSGFIERELIYRILRGPEGARLRAIATLGDQESPDGKGNSLDQGELVAEPSTRRVAIAKQPIYSGAQSLGYGIGQVARSFFSWLERDQIECRL